MQIQEFIVKVKRAESPFFARLKWIAKQALTFHLPIPRALDWLFLWISNLKTLRFEFDQRAAVAIYRFPLLRARCAYVGNRLQMEQA
ncbi:MAG: hypothetical protein ACRD3S_19955, partial [Terracidiphilus sp.]